MSIFLYGGDVGRIQNFIKTTNTLREIVGASELVEYVTKDLPLEILNWEKENPQIIQTAAGHIRIAFKNEEDCRRLVESLPMKIAEEAPGLQFNQAVVRIEENFSKKDWDLLTKRLQFQKNKPTPPHSLGLMATQNSRRTGEPAVKHSYQKLEYPDAASVKKLDAFQNKGRLSQKSLPEIFKKHKSPENFEDWMAEGDWMAVIHADGNSLGQTLIKLWEEKWKASDALQKIKKFSKQLEDSTSNAFKDAVIDVFSEYVNNDYVPFRSIVIGGDDITLVCKAKDALKFTHSFITHFEIQTKEIADIKGIGLTACAGIVFIKSNYPFSQAEAFAEELCKEAKKVSKNSRDDADARVPSSIYFHKIQGSYVESIDELKRIHWTCESDLSFNAGPYFTDEEAPELNQHTVEGLMRLVNKLEEIGYRSRAKGIKSKIRQWLTYAKKKDTQSEANKIIELLLKDLKGQELINFKNDLQDLGLLEVATISKAKSPALDLLTISNLLNTSSEQ
jgi:hypothetical protein